MKRFLFFPGFVALLMQHSAIAGEGVRCSVQNVSFTYWRDRSLNHTKDCLDPKNSRVIYCRTDYISKGSLNNEFKKSADGMLYVISMTFDSGDKVEVTIDRVSGKFTKTESEKSNPEEFGGPRTVVSNGDCAPEDISPRF